MGFKIYIRVIGLLVITLVLGCNSEDNSYESGIPDYIDNLENLTVYEPYIQLSDTVKLFPELLFESNEEVFFDGYISDFTIDELNNVYIAISKPGSASIHKYSSNGTYIKTMGEFGRGPGEFESITSLNIQGDSLFVFDTRLQKLAVYSVSDDFTLIREALIKRERVLASDQIDGSTIGNKLIVIDKSLLLRMGSRLLDSKDRKSRYFSLSPDGVIKPGIIMELNEFSYYHPQRTRSSGGVSLPVTMPFTRSSLASVTNDGNFFTAWTDDFLIKHYDSNGKYLNSFYYPINKSPLNMNDIVTDRYRSNILKYYTMPNTWPALHTMEPDDEGRLWVATITDSKTEFTWWVLNRDGELLARFAKPGNRSRREVSGVPLITIKDGYFYSHERDFSEGIDRIVKHRIEFIKR